MKPGFQRPGLFISHPNSFCAIRSIRAEGRVELVNVPIGECAFRCRGSDPEFGCKLATCKHTHHTSGAFSHFFQDSEVYSEEL